MNISAQLVKELRDKTGAGMMDCKKALQEVEGELDKAIDWLRQKGLSKAAKKAGRATSEGRFACIMAADGKAGTLVEVKCETDFVARNDKFQALLDGISALVSEKAPANTDALLALNYSAADPRPVSDVINDFIATIGENTTIGRLERLQLASEGRIGNYVHSNGKIAVLVEAECADSTAAASDKMQEFLKNVAMQIAAASPVAVTADAIDPQIIAREREVYRQKAIEDGKPENIIEKIVDGAVKKYCKEVCLLDQPYIRDDKMTINDLTNALGKELGAPVKITRFVRLQLGEE